MHSLCEFRHADAIRDFVFARFVRRQRPENREWIDVSIKPGGSTICGLTIALHSASLWSVGESKAGAD